MSFDFANLLRRSIDVQETQWTLLRSVVQRPHLPAKNTQVIVRYLLLRHRELQGSPYALEIRYRGQFPELKMWVKFNAVYSAL